MYFLLYNTWLASKMVTRVCEAFGVHDMRVRESNQPLGHVTLSADVVAVRGREAKAVMAAANDQLRRAKQGGRNHVAIESIVVGIAGGADGDGEKAP